MTFKKPYVADCDACDRRVFRRMEFNGTGTLEHIWIRCKECGTPLPAEPK